MELGLFENAITSIVHGLDHYVEGLKDPINYKFAVLHVAQGIELLLKERLAREHPVLIYEKVERPGGRTVDFDGARERLLNICNVSLAKYQNGLQALKKARNEIEHHKVTLPKSQAAALIGSNVPFLVEFLAAEFDTQLKDELSEETWQELLAIEQVYSLAKEKADQEIESVRRAEREGDYCPVWSCGICGEQYVVESDEGGEHRLPQAKCLLCNHLSELKTCWKCGELFPEDDWEAEGGLCASCADYIKQPNT